MKKTTAISSAPPRTRHPLAIAIILALAVLWATTYTNAQETRNPGNAEGEAAAASEQWLTDEAALGLDEVARKNVQRGLRSEGFDPGVPDGIFGAGTRNAIRQWQSARNYQQTGYLNAAQAESLQAAGSDAAPSAAIDATDCANWNTHVFFESATPENVTACLAAGADVMAKDDLGYAPLHFAAEYNDSVAVLRILLDRGGDPVGRTGRYGIAPIHFAAGGSKNPEIIRMLLDAGAQIEEMTETGGHTPLDLAAAANESEVIIRFLLANGASPAARNNNGSTPLHRAAANTKNPEVIRALIEGGADIDARMSNGGDTPLQQAIWNNENPEVAETLIRAGADTEVRSGRGSTLLHNAASGNDSADVLRLVLSSGGNPSARDDRGWTPLHHAAANTDNPEIIYALIEAGASIDEELPQGGNTPLILAVLNNEDSSIWEALIQEGADARVRGLNGETLLHIAVEEDRSLEALSVLIDVGTPINVSVRSIGTPLHAVAANKEFGSAAIQALIEAGANVNARKPGSGETALHLVARKGDMKSYQMLVAEGARPDALTERGKTVLHDAVCGGNLDLVSAILESGSDVKAKTATGVSVLHHAARCDNVDIFNLLVGEGADIDAECERGRSMLHFAASGNGKIAELLLQGGADVRAKDNDGKEPIETAIDSYHSRFITNVVFGGGPPEENSSDAIQVLLEFGAGTIDSEGRSLLLSLASGGHTEPSRLLIDAGANVHERYGDGTGLLHLAAGAEHDGAMDLVELLIESGLNANARDEYGNTPLHEVKNAGTLGVLVAAGGNVNARDQWGRTPLLSSAARDSAEVVDALLEAGADVGSRDEKGESAMVKAVRSTDDVAVIRSLERAGLRITDAATQGGSALHLAARGNDSVAVLQYLIDSGISVNARNANGSTALHFAAFDNGNSDIVRALLEAGASVRVTDWAQRTPLHQVILSAGPEGAFHWALRDGKPDDADAWERRRFNEAIQEIDTRITMLLERGADPNAMDSNGKTALDLAREIEGLNGTDVYWRLNDLQFN